MSIRVTDLGKISLTFEGDYDSSRTYDRNTCVFYQNSTYVTLHDGVRGIAPNNEGIDWRIISQSGSYTFDEVGGYEKITTTYAIGHQAYENLKPKYSYLVNSGDYAGYVFIKDSSVGSGWSSIDFRGPVLDSIEESSSNVDDGINSISLKLSNNATLGTFTVKNGSRGSRWHLGTFDTGDTSSSLQIPLSSLSEIPRVGDMYLDSDTMNIFQCASCNLTDSTWNFVGSLKCFVRADAFFAAAGTIEDRSRYDSESSGFTFFDTEQGVFYVKIDNGWSNPISFKGDKGDTGEKGDKGDMYTPVISDVKVLSWKKNGEDDDTIEPVNLMQIGTNVMCSIMPPEKPYDGLMWVKSKGESYSYVSRLRVVESPVQPQPEEGLIWIIKE